MAGDQGDPNTDNPPPSVGVEDGFLLASSTSGLRTTPLDRAIVVAGTPLRQQQRFAVGSVGSPSSSEDEDDSPPLLSVPEMPVLREVSTVAASSLGLIAAAPPDDLNAILAVLSDVRRDIGLIREDTHRLTSESAALVELNRSTHLAVNSNVSTFLRALEDSDAQTRIALDAQRASFVQYIGEANRSIAAITAAHTQSMTDMQSKIQTFDRMRYLEKTFKDVPQHVTNHLDTTVPHVIASAVDRTLPTTLATVLQESLSPTIKKVMDDTISDSFTSLLEGSFTDFTEKCSSVSTDVARVMCDVVASAEAPFLERYLAVQEDYTTCKARLDEVLTHSSLLRGACPLRHRPRPLRPTCIILRLVGGDKNATPVFHKAGLKISISLTVVMLVRTADLVVGSLLVFPLSTDMFALLPLTSIPVMTGFWVAGLPLLVSRTVPVSLKPNTRASLIRRASRKPNII